MIILSNERIFPVRSGWSCHASSHLLLTDGSIFAVWFYGSAEGASDVCIYGAKRTVNTHKWSTPVRLTAEDGFAHWNPVLFLRHDGSVMLFYKVGATIADWHTEIMISYDGCETFSSTRPLVAGDISGGRGPVRNKPVYLSCGDIIAPGSTERGEWKCFFDISHDDGMTWERSDDISLPTELIEAQKGLPDDKHGNLHGIIQPTLWESAPGCVHALMRSTVGRIFRSDSTDGGRHWSLPYDTGHPNNNSGIDITRLPDGKLLLAYNPIGKNWGKRSPLRLALSEDNGLTFNRLSELATGDGVFAYPCITAADGVVRVTYTEDRLTIKYIEIEL